MFTLKNIFWATLVLLNLTFIAVVSYTRLVPVSEVHSYRSENVPIDNLNDKGGGRYGEPNLGARQSKTNGSDPSLKESMRYISRTNKEAGDVELRASRGNESNTSENGNSKQNPKPSKGTVETSDAANVKFAFRGDKSNGSGNSRPNPASSGTVEIPAAADMNALNAQYDKVLINNEQNKRDISEEKHKVDTFYDGNLVRTEESDNDGNVQVMAKETMNMSELGKLPDDDVRYIEALNQLGREHEPQKAQDENLDEVISAPISGESNHNDSIDYFNKIDVSVETREQHVDSNIALAKQIENTISGGDFSDSGRDKNSTPKDSSPKKSDDLFFQALETESKERINEMRTVKITYGDTLWDIAVRAYGSGFEYKRIFEANPYLSNPDKIKVGDTLRVPI